MALDSGLSTGGFADCLLQRGAARVYGVDVGFGQARSRQTALKSCRSNGVEGGIPRRSRGLISGSGPLWLVWIRMARFGPADAGLGAAVLQS